MKVQIVANVVPVSIAFIPSLLHQNHIGITYAGISNFSMEPIRSMPLHSVAMPLFIIIVTKPLFVLEPI
jgi:hypothetical protein